MSRDSSCGVHVHDSPKCSSPARWGLWHLSECGGQLSDPGAVVTGRKDGEPSIDVTLQQADDLRKWDGVGTLQQVVPGVAVSGVNPRRRGNTGKELIPGSAQALGRDPRQRLAKIASSDLEDNELPVSEVGCVQAPIAADSARSRAG